MLLPLAAEATGDVENAAAVSVPVGVAAEVGGKGACDGAVAVICVAAAAAVAQG